MLIAVHIGLIHAKLKFDRHFMETKDQILIEISNGYGVEATPETSYAISGLPQTKHSVRKNTKNGNFVYILSQMFCLTMLYYFVSTVRS
jgi:hypothetical protein